MARRKKPSLDDRGQALDDDRVCSPLVVPRRGWQRSLGEFEDESLLDDLTSLTALKVLIDFMMGVYSNNQRTTRALAEITNAVKALERSSTELAQLTTDWRELDGISQIVLDLDSAIAGAGRALDRIRGY